MHLVFTSYEGKSEFKIQEKNETDLNMEDIFIEYSDSEKWRAETMSEYFSLFEEEKMIAQKRKQMLIDLKRDFTEVFLPEIEEKNPEYFI